MDTIIELRLAPADLELLDRWRGHLSREDFMLALLRMFTSRRIGEGPELPEASD